MELVGGLLTNSVAIISDALHDLGDSVSLGLGWYLQKVAGKESDNQFSFGYKRFSLLAAIINSLILVIGSIMILYTAVPRLFHPTMPNATGMLGLAILGVIVNSAAVFRLRKGKSLNESVVSWHLLEDVLGWLSVLIVSIVLMFWELPVLDPALSILITLFILYNVAKSLKQSWKIVLQSVPENVNLSELKSKMLSFSRVKSVHDLHTWTLDGEYNILTAHVVVEDETDKDGMAKIKCDIKDALMQHNIQHATLEMELEKEDCGHEKLI